MAPNADGFDGPSIVEVSASEEEILGHESVLAREEPTNIPQKNGVSRQPRLSLEGPLQRAVSDISVELSRNSIEAAASMNSQVEKVECQCCGLSEECTPTYICRIRELFCGRWICGLCAEAVKEERHRMGLGTAMEDALRAHMDLCEKFNKLARTNPALFLADAMRELLKKSCQGQANGLRSKPNSPRLREITKGNITRSASCIPVLTRERKPNS
eukprot:Gb_03054 [translate_table: standard]